jgi:hypothetical protein
MTEFAESHRHEYDLATDEDLFLAVAWVIPEEKRLFHLFTDVIHIDGTMKTNNEGRPLVTITGRDSRGNQFTILRAFLPNERAWSFRWLFQNAMPCLLGPEFMARIRIIVTDGDSQETSQVDNAIAKFRDLIDQAVGKHFPKTQRVRCGWHAIEKGWDRRGLNSVSRWRGECLCLQSHCDFLAVPVSLVVFSFLEFLWIVMKLEGITGAAFVEFRRVADNVKHWLWSFVQRNKIESEEEYKISKALLQHYIRSNTDTLTKEGADMMLDFIKNSFETQEDYLCFHKRFAVRHFDSYSNSGHEGTNNGLKHNAAPVGPQYDLHKSGMTLTDNARIKAKGSAVLASKEVSKTRLWSNLPCAEKVTNMGVGLAEHEWKEADMYACECCAIDKFLVARQPDDASGRIRSPIPRFARVRVVCISEVKGRKILKCSCKHFERVGIPCRHILAVYKKLIPGFLGVLATDISVFWWSSYLLYAYRRKDRMSLYEQRIARALALLRENDTEGPRLPKDIGLDSFELCEAIPALLHSKEPIMSCQNWLPCVITRALAEADGAPFGLSQLNFSPPDQYDYDYDDFMMGGDDNQEGTDNDNLESSEEKGERFVPDKELYSVVKPHFSEWASVAPGNVTYNQRNQVISLLKSQTLEIKKRRREENQLKKEPYRSRGPGDRRKKVSTNPALENCLTTHGNNRGHL